MKLSTYITLAYSIFVLSNLAFVRGQNKTSNETDPDAPEYHLQNYVNKLLRSAFVKEFNSIMSDKNKQIRSLEEQIVEKDKIIKLHKSNMKLNTSAENTSAENTFIVSQSTKDENENKNTENLELKLFVKKRIRALFQKELDKIIREKDAHIYLLKQLLVEKEKTIKLQKRYLKRETNKLLSNLLDDGFGEPSY